MQRCGYKAPELRKAPSGRYYRVSGIKHEPIGTWWVTIIYADNNEVKDVPYNQIKL